ncbi:Zinc finger protein klf1 [Colletotrichum orbiculare MAFF 240422]|uniref:Zinc finger protein klf1 n=1 Tax=Colletotrichum orbiculare (strain 104-T / ATCC 96160 / CBS 514.97 / LARS 414 / MAFF 240422) TaxID=1213857 RepID=A0A484G9B1_COLOR|nr:Zinc finger protein klf1 [Colletotrichum orbiculare MAFF 240422]
MAPTHLRPSPQQYIKQEHDGDRGRLRQVSDEKDADLADDDVEDGKANSSNSDGPARKRRRSRKGLDKKFECPQEGCGKSYSRAEHLYRHQLNHTPKQIYACDFPDCSRTFVRLDLCNRHRDRHTAKGSALNRKDSIMSHMSPTTDRPPYAIPGSASPEISRPGTSFANARPSQMQHQSPKDASGSPFVQAAPTPPAGYPVSAQAAADGYMHHDNGYGNVQAHRPPHQQSPNGQRPTVQTNGPYMSPISNQHGYQGQQHSTPQSGAYTTQQNFPPFTLPPSDFSIGAGSVPREGGQTYAPTTTAEYTEQGHPQQSGEMMLLDQMSMPGTIPVFGSDTILNKSPYVTIPEDFVAYLFNTQQGEGSPMGQMVAPGYVNNNYGEYQSSYSVPYVGTEGVQMGYFPSGPNQVMAVNNLLDQNLPEATISEEKSQEIYDFINQRFHENDQAPALRQRDSILEGDRSDGDHMLSKRMMQAYIGSYWVHFSDQIPILHKPTFSPERTPNLLLLAMMTIGAACLDKTHGQKVTKAGAQLSNFLAWHLRWEIFMDPNFRPPAKLWVFQALLLLELYEKMYSTRELHERAHIHHATTITLMRRGRSLIGKSALDSPPNPRDDKHSSRHSSASGLAHTADDWWNHWITNESTRRAAFAAFVIDSIHATMFGHSTVMVTHEMRLPLPCDESLWKATSGAEVGRVESNLLSNGIKPISFLEGLKRTLSGQNVHTNPFGRMVLMAGLLSVSWHMNQRDLQVNVLGGGVSQALGGRDKWRGTLTRAFDAWRQDFDKSLSMVEGSSDPYRFDSAKKYESNVVFESRTVLHHLAHMAMHVDIVDCQIFARAKRLLGRAIGQQDLNSAQRRMRDLWAPSAKARDATYYALKFLCSVLMPDAGGASPQAGGPNYDEPYTARDDVLLNRPWVLYFAALVVWCYGFALEGPCPDIPLPKTKQEQVRQMREYLSEYGSGASPEDLKNLKGLNANSALLLVLKDSFGTTRWELLHEGANLLNNCLQLNAGATT